MLPRAGGVGVADDDGLILLECAQDVWHQAVCRPITTADDVARAGGGQGNTFFLKEGAAIGAGDQLCAAFAVAVGVVAAHGFVFTVAPGPFFVFVAFVGSDVDHGLDVGGVAHRFEQMHRAHDVGGVGFNRVLVGIAHQGLCRHVDDDLWAVFSEDCLQFGQVTDIPDDTGHAFANISNFEQARVGRRRQCITHHVGTHGLQPERQPTALEAGVAGQQDAFAIPKCWIHDQTFHGALPDCQNSSR